MNDDYLWDKTGPASPDLIRLETALGRLRTVRPAPRLPRPSRVRRPGWALAAVAAVLLLSVRWDAGRRPAPTGAARTTSWSLTSVEGAARLDGQAAAAGTRLRGGVTVVTDAASTASLSSDDVGRVVVEPGSRLRLLEGGSHHRLALDRGSLQAFIVAPPGRFVVETQSATAVDLGCVYRLRVAEDGATWLSVEAGWVGFEFEGLESFVPAGASCRTAPGHGPGLPTYDDAPAAFVRAVEAFDQAVSRSAKADALAHVLGAARTADAFTLWHVVQRVPPDERPGVVTALAARVPLPGGVTRNAVVALDRAALDRWWNAFDLGDVNVWRAWKQPHPPEGAAAW